MPLLQKQDDEAFLRVSTQRQPFLDPREAQRSASKPKEMERPGDLGAVEAQARPCLERFDAVLQEEGPFNDERNYYKAVHYAPINDPIPAGQAQEDVDF